MYLSTHHFYTLIHHSSTLQTTNKNTTNTTQIYVQHNLHPNHPIET